MQEAEPVIVRHVEIEYRNKSIPMVHFGNFNTIKIPMQWTNLIFYSQKVCHN